MWELCGLLGKAKEVLEVEVAITTLLWWQSLTKVWPQEEKEVSKASM